MILPWRSISIFAATGSYTLVSFRPDLLFFSKPTYLGTFLQLWILGLAVWAVWAVMLYPKYFSPMRHLPGPKVRLGDTE